MTNEFNCPLCSPYMMWAARTELEARLSIVRHLERKHNLIVNYVLNGLEHLCTPPSEVHQTSYRTDMGWL